MEAVDYTRFIFAFFFVIGLIGISGLLLKKYVGTERFLRAKDAGERLSVLETRYIDPKRKIVLIRRDNTEHLLLLGEGMQTVIESNIHSKVGGKSHE